MTRRATEAWGSKDRQKRHADLDQATIDAWCAVLDMKGFDSLSAQTQAQNVANFLRLFRIPTEEEGDEAWFEMTGSYSFQFDNLVTTFEDWNRGVRADFINPKSRRRGCSSGWEGFFFERIVRVPGWRGAIIAQTDPDAMKHLEFLHGLKLQLPKAALARMNIRPHRSGAREIAFIHGRHRVSSVIVKTASARGLGRGGQLNGILQTERPHWAPKSKRDRSAFIGSCRRKPGNLVIDESTANQHDEFYEDTMAAERGEDGAPHLIFLPSHEHAINREPFRSKVHRERLMEALGKDKRFGERNEIEAYEKRLLWRTRDCGWDEERATLDALEFCNWRRQKIAGPDCGNLMVFWREEPTTIDEAFKGAAKTVLPYEIMESWKSDAQRRSLSGQEGTLHVMHRDGKKRIEFVRKRAGMLTVYEEPDPNGAYCFGSDVAAGFEVHASSGTEADFSCAIVKEVYSGRTVARIHGHIFPKPFAEMLLMTAAWYNGAKGYVENNLDAVVAVMIEDEDLECLGYVGEDVLLTSERKMRVAGVGTQVQEVYGFRTTEQSKRYLVARHERFMVEWGEDDGTKGCPVDQETLRQMMKMVRKATSLEKARGSKTKTKIEAEVGHDDLWVAEALAVTAREELLTSGEVPLQSKVNTDRLPLDSTSRHFALKAMRGADQQHDPLLGVGF